MNISRFLIPLTIFLLLPATAQAAYVRIWRGHQKAELSTAAFVQGMNHALLPATGELAHGQARLQSYLPVILPEELKEAGLPAEVALLSYESEEAYRAYRATPEGIHYGNMHWDLFDRATSGSLVPTPYAGSVAFEQAYEVAGQDPTWSQGEAFFRVLKREPGLSDPEFLAVITTRIESTRRGNPISYYVVVARDYALEYLNTEAKTSDTSALTSTFETALPFNKTLAVGTGVRYPVTVDPAFPGTRAVWEHHIAAWNARDLDAIVADYHDESVVIRNDEVYRGRTEIRAFFAGMFARFDLTTEASLDRIIAQRNVVYITWRAAGRDAAGAAISSRQGTDTFVISKGRIDVQTIAADPLFWSTTLVR